MTDPTPFTLIDGDFRGRLVLTCEHAGDLLPPPWSWPEGDARLIGTHWACDIGADSFTRRLAATLDAPAVLSNFTRLLVDPNRPLDSETLFRLEADGEPVWLNATLDDADRRKRIDDYYHPYHAASSRMVRKSSAEIVFGVHTFTSNYEGNQRALEVGILFDREEDLGHSLVAHLQDAGFVSAPNEPYSGKDGLAYAPVLHANEYGRRAVEIEVRQDLVIQEEFAAKLAGALGSFFS
ncbi:MAG: N-formylglutamate amidohydrolase [Polyangiales bacterium]